MKQIDLLILGASQVVSFKSDNVLVGNAFAQQLQVISADVAIDKGIIIAIEKDLDQKYTAKETIDASNKTVIAGFVDVHTHLPHYGSRSFELEAKISGISSYDQLHKRGGGILYTVEQTRKASFNELVAKGLKDLDRMLCHGTTTIEAKSGYGLSEIDEIKLLKVIAKLNALHPIDIIPTFLGAHTIPKEFKDRKSAYVQFILELIPKIKDLATYCDVFCDPLGFNKEDTIQIIKVAQEHGLKGRIHIDQTASCGGGKAAIESHAVSVSHADYTSDDELQVMSEKQIFVELLPGVTYHLAESIKGGKHLKDFWPERVAKMKEMQLPLVLATDYNPGSANILSMQAIMEHASRIYRMDYATILGAATLNAAHSIGRSNTIGNIQVGKNADLVIFDVEEYGSLIDQSGANLVSYVIKNGILVVNNTKKYYG